MKPSCAIIIPVYNEERAIADTVIVDVIVRHFQIVPRAQERPLVRDASAETGAGAADLPVLSEPLPVPAESSTRDMRVASN